MISAVSVELCTAATYVETLLYLAAAFRDLIFRRWILQLFLFCVGKFVGFHIIFAARVSG